LLDYLIKLNCERCKYEALFKSYEDLRKFEYHRVNTFPYWYRSFYDCLVR